MDRPIGSNPQCLASGTVCGRAKRREIGELPGNEPDIRPDRTVQAPGQPLGAGCAEGTVPVEDEPREVPNRRHHGLQPTDDSGRPTSSTPKATCTYLAVTLHTLHAVCKTARKLCRPRRPTDSPRRITDGRSVDFPVSMPERRSRNIDSRPWAGGSMRKTSPPYAIGHGSRR